MSQEAVLMAMEGNALSAAAREALLERDPDRKLAFVERLDRTLLDRSASVPSDDLLEPGRPPKPSLVPPRQLKKRGLGSQAGRCALLHAVAHIEFNAINLALDAIWRFPGKPGQFYLDWLGVAKDEARHFAMLRKRLQELGMQYGDLPAHNGLWEMCIKTRHSCLERMALVPRVLEARGLDVSPGMIHALEQNDDTASAALLRIILEEEVGHVAVGTRWFRYECEQAGKEPKATFVALIKRHMKGMLRGPFNHEARRAAGFDADELSILEAGL